MGVYNGAGRIMFFALIIPGTVPFLLVTLRLAAIPRSQTFLVVSVMVMSAILLDGIALAWFSVLYQSNVHYIAGVGGTIFWGAGLVLHSRW